MERTGVGHFSINIIRFNKKFEWHELYSGTFFFEFMYWISLTPTTRIHKHAGGKAITT